MTTEAEAAAREAAEAVIKEGKGDGTDLASVVLMAASIQTAQHGQLTMESHVQRTQALHSEAMRLVLFACKAQLSMPVRTHTPPPARAPYPPIPRFLLLLPPCA